MIEQEKNNRGQFVRKGSSDRVVRSIRLTNETWEVLGEKADEHDMTRADYLEALASEKVNWNEEEESESSLDFDVDEVTEKLKEALKLRPNAGGKIKAKIREALEIMGVDLDDDD